MSLVYGHLLFFVVCHVSVYGPGLIVVDGSVKCLVEKGTCIQISETLE